MGEQGGGQDGGGRERKPRLASEVEARIRSKLNLCGLLARGMWHEVRYLIETQCDRPGHLQKRGGPFPDEQLANAVRCSSGEAPQLLAVLRLVELLEQNDAGVYHAPELTALYELRDGGRQRSRRCRARDKRVTCAQRDADVTRSARAPPAPSPSPPLTPPLTPTPTPSAGAAPQVPAEPATPAATAGKPATKRRKSEKQRTTEEHRIRNGLIAWFCKTWGEWHNGADYDFFSEDKEKQPINQRSMWVILDELLWNEEHAYQVLGFFARWCADSFAQFRVPLKHLAKDPKKWLRLAQQNETAGKLKIGSDDAGSERQRAGGAAGGIYVRGVYKPSAAERGEFPEPDEPLPEFGRDDDGSTAAVAG